MGGPGGQWWALGASGGPWGPVVGPGGPRKSPEGLDRAPKCSGGPAGRPAHRQLFLLLARRNCSSCAKSPQKPGLQWVVAAAGASAHFGKQLLAGAAGGGGAGAGLPLLGGAPPLGHRFLPRVPPCRAAVPGCTAPVRRARPTPGPGLPPPTRSLPPPHGPGHPATPRHTPVYTTMYTPIIPPPYAISCPAAAAMRVCPPC